MKQAQFDTLLTQLLMILALGIVGYQMVSHQYNIWLYGLSCISLVWVIFHLCHISGRQIIEFFLLDSIIMILDSIAWYAGYQVRVATGSDSEEIYRIRYQVYQEKGYIKPQDQPLLIDEYDPFSSHMVMIHRGQVCGAMRMVYWSSVQGFPSEEYYHIDWRAEELTSIVEVGRWVVLPEYRKKTKKFPLVTILLGLKTYLFLIRNQKKKMLVTISKRLKTYLEELFLIQFEDIPELPLTPDHRAARKFFQGYFDQYKQIEASVLRLSIDELFQSLGRFFKHKTQKWIHTALSV